MSKLLDFKKPEQPFAIRNKTPTTAEIIIYSAIGESVWGDSVSAKSFSDELKKLDKAVNQIDVRINSPGGDVFSGVAIYNRLKQHPAKVVCYIDGLAASIASIIALAGDEIIMGDGALFMVHLPWTYTMGDRNDLENTVNRLIDIEEQLISIYAKKTKLGRAEIKKMLEDETWMDATQAIEQGFVDSLAEDSVPIAASVKSKATWINKFPSLKTQDDLIKIEIENLKNKVSGFISR